MSDARSVLRQRVERQALASALHRQIEIAGLLGGTRRAHRAALADPLAMCLARLEHPVVVEVAEQIAAGRAPAPGRRARRRAADRTPARRSRCPDRPRCRRWCGSLRCTPPPVHRAAAHGGQPRPAGSRARSPPARPARTPRRRDCADACPDATPATPAAPARARRRAAPERGRRSPPQARRTRGCGAPQRRG